MGWRLHLSTQPVSAVQFIGEGTEKPQVAIWDSRHNVHFYDRLAATPLGELHLADWHPPDDLHDPEWQEQLQTLRAPNGDFLPSVYLSHLAILQSGDGRLRLYHFADGRLILEIEDRHVPLQREDDGRFLAVGLDRALGPIGAVNEDGALTLFQQHVRIETVDLGLNLDMEARLDIAVPEGMGRLVVSDGAHVLMVDAAGRILHQMEAFFTVGGVATAPDGSLIALADIDDNLVRVYDSTLRPTHQKHAIDLVIAARQVQLLASLPGRKAGLGTLEVADSGNLIFGLGGIVCVTNLKALDELPQLRPLL